MLNSDKKIVSSHQPHFFPWLGYLDKMARSDIFIINDICQITLKSPMTRNKVLDLNRNWHYFTVSIIKKDYLNKENRSIKLKAWGEDRAKMEGLLRMCYGRAPFWNGIWADIRELLFSDYEYLIDLQMASINYLRKCFDINTHLVMQSNLDCQEKDSKSLKIVEKVKKVGSSTYLAGNGAKKYLDSQVLLDHGIDLYFQNFIHPAYPQRHIDAFVEGMSSLDILFNCGKDQARKLFWDNVVIEKSIQEI